MFKLDVSDTYSCPVAFDVPVNGGRVEKITFDATFKRLTRPEVIEVMQRVRDGETTDQELLREVLVGWKGVTDGAGADVPFSIEAVDKANNIVQFAPAVIAAWGASLGGGKAKN